MAVYKMQKKKVSLASEEVKTTQHVQEVIGNLSLIAQKNLTYNKTNKDNEQGAKGRGQHPVTYQPEMIPLQV